jgi:NAD(P)-dependent dehydrogenase (short-subunit alcohol dehydrogenase family)
MVVLITGCRSGFGLLTAVSAAQAGHTVYAGLRDLSTDGDLKEAARGLDVTPVQLDVTDPEQREAVVSDIEARHGALGGLVNNAGIAISGAIEDFSEAELRRVFEVNVFALWALTCRVLPEMRARKSGIIVNVSSMAGRAALPTMGVYAASKHAVTGMTEALRLELHPHGVRACLIEPGPYKTDLFNRNRNICEGSQREDSPYRTLISGMLKLASETEVTAGDPQQVADRIIAVLGTSSPPLWNPMGPKVTARRLARWMLPGSLYEQLIRRVVYSR